MKVKLQFWTSWRISIPYWGGGDSLVTQRRRRVRWWKTRKSRDTVPYFDQASHDRDVIPTIRMNKEN
jgi:hypothetical protein